MEDYSTITFEPIDGEIISADYMRGYNDAVEKACEWIMNTPMYAKQPSQLVDEFKKEMEE